VKILVVDDNRSSAEAMSRILRKQGHTVQMLFDGASAQDVLRSNPPDLVFTDLQMEPVDGMEVLRTARSLHPPVEVVVFTAFGAVDKAVEAMQRGARDFLTKPISVQQILDRVGSLAGQPVLPEPAATGTSMLDAATLRLLGALADVPSPVWIEGEVGSGRQTAVAELASLSGSGPPIPVDVQRFAGWPERGLAVLSDVDELDADDQARLYRHLRSVPPDVRLVATARPGSQDRVAEGLLRSDLYFSLAVVVVTLAPLRNRVDQIPQLFQRALEDSCQKYGRELPLLTEAQQRALSSYDWPGNLKELRNLAERTAVLGAAGFALAPATNPMATTATDASLFTEDFRLADHLEAIEADLLRLAMETADGDRTIAGRLLGVERNTLRYKLKKYGLLS
jgi:two-component system response regulator HydG